MDQAQNTSAEIGGSNGTMRYQTNDGTTTTIVDDAKEKLNQVINAIQKILLLLHQLHLTVSSFTPDSQLHLLQRLNSLVMELDNMTKLSDKCNIQVPMEVLNLIDDGKNPDEFTKDVLNNSCTAINQVTKGKTDAFKGLRKHLLEELQQTFPDEVDTYREIRASYAAKGEYYITISKSSHSRQKQISKLQKIKFHRHLCEPSRRKMKEAVLSLGRRIKRIVISVQHNAWSWTWLVCSKTIQRPGW